MKSEDQHHDSHTQHLPRNAHRGQSSGCDAIKLLLYGAHYGIGVRRGEKSEAQSQRKKDDHNEKNGCLIVKENQKPQAEGREAHSDGGDDAWLNPVGKSPRKGRKNSLYDRLSNENQPGMEGAQSFDILKIETEEKGHGESGAIIDQCRQIRKDEDFVMTKQCDVEKRILYLSLTRGEDNNQDEANDDKIDSKSSCQRRKPVHYG